MVILVAGLGFIKHNDNDWKFHSYRGTNLCYDMLCKSVNSDQEEKEGDLPNLNRIINLMAPWVATTVASKNHCY